ncbi:MAG: tyrosine-type recombinase/integrase [Muribaculaceae bacterium]
MIIDEFLTYMRYELNHSPQSLKAYKNDLRQWVSFATDGKTEDFRAEDVTTSDLRTWVAHLSGKGISARSIRRKASSLRAFYRFMIKRHGLKSNPANDLVLARPPKKLPAVISHSQIERVVNDIPSGEDFAAMRQYLIVQILYQTGIRASELYSLLDADVDTEARTLKVLGKRNKQRIVPFGQELCDLIDRYRSLRDERTVASPALLVTDKGVSMTYAQVYHAVRSALDTRVSSPKRSPHVLRHTFATEMLNAGADLNSVKQLLGHESLETTQIYTHISISEIQQNYQLAHPRAQKKGGPHGSKNPSHPL